jgi:hypothetical protein
MNWRDAFKTAGQVAGGFQRGGMIGAAGSAIGSIQKQRQHQGGCFGNAKSYTPTEVDDDDGSPAPDQPNTYYSKLRGQY